MSTYQYEGVQKMTFNAGGTEARIVGLEEHHTDDIIADMSFALEFLWIVFLIGQQCGHVEHDLNVAPIRIDGE